MTIFSVPMRFYLEPYRTSKVNFCGLFRFFIFKKSPNCFVVLTLFCDFSTLLKQIYTFLCFILRKYTKCEDWSQILDIQIINPIVFKLYYKDNIPKIYNWYYFVIFPQDLQNCNFHLKVILNVYIILTPNLELCGWIEKIKHRLEQNKNIFYTANVWI